MSPDGSQTVPVWIILKTRARRSGYLLFRIICRRIDRSRFSVSKMTNAVVTSGPLSLRHQRLALGLWASVPTRERSKLVSAKQVIPGRVRLGAAP